MGSPNRSGFPANKSEALISKAEKRGVAGLLIGILLLSSFLGYLVPQAKAATNEAMVVYDTNTAYGYESFYRTWNGSAWSAESKMPTMLSNGQVRFTRTVYSPSANEAVTVMQTSTGKIDAWVWNGSAWGDPVNIGDVGSANNTSRGFDVSYESSSGDAVVVMGDDTADPNYRVWDGSSWSSASDIDVSTTSDPRWIVTASDPTSDEISMILVDAAGDTFGCLWTGSAWDCDWDNTGANPDVVWDATSSQTTGTRENVAVAYELTSGDALFIWGNNTQDQVLYKTYVGTTLSADNTLTIAALDAAIDWVILRSNTNSGEDDILIGVQGATPDISTRRWSGSAWDSATEHPEHDIGVEDATARNFDIVWETHSSNLNTAWMVYGDAATASRKQMTSRTAGSTNWGAATTSGDDTNGVFGDASPGNGAIVFAIHQDSTSTADDVLEWNRASDGSTWSAGTGSIWTGATVDPTYDKVSVRCRRDTGNDCLIIYGKEATAPGSYTSSYRIWDGSAWGSPSTTSPVRGGGTSTTNRGPMFNELVFSPTADEAIYVTQSIVGEIDAQVWNGATWSSAVRMTVSNGATIAANRTFDIAYETATGDAVLVYDDNTADPDYRIWDGASWSSASNIDLPTTGVPSWIELASSPKSGSEELAMIVLDANADVVGRRWTGSTWSDMSDATVWDATAAPIAYKAIDVAFENDSGDILFIWGDTTATDQYYRTYSGSLGSATLLDIAAAGGTVRYAKLVSDPTSGSDNILYAEADSASDLNTRKWSGSAWDTATEHPEHTGTTEIATDGTFAVVWETHSSNPNTAWIMWGDGATADATTVSHRRAVVTAGTLAWGTANTLTADDTTSFQMIAQPDNGALLAMQYQASGSANDDLVESHITGGGTTWNAIAQIWAGATNTTVPTWGRYALATQPNIAAAGELTVDIVDSGGASVTSPSVAMSTATFGLGCQTIGGTFGTSGEKIRTTNTTSTPTWTLSVAASSVTDLWNSAGTDYDFNDSGGSGCTDGGDADSVGGQMTIDASGGTLTPEGGCANTGLTLGSSNSFVQGTTNDITIITAGGSAETSCYWDLTGVSISQKIPAAQPAASDYNINIVLSVVAS